MEQVRLWDWQVLPKDTDEAYYAVVLEPWEIACPLKAQALAALTLQDEYSKDLERTPFPQTRSCELQELP